MGSEPALTDGTHSGMELQLGDQWETPHIAAWRVTEYSHDNIQIRAVAVERLEGIQERILPVWGSVLIDEHAELLDCFA